MFSALPAPKLDPILKVMALYRDDPRADKVDLGVGVYKNDTGNTPVMRAVKSAERRLVETQTTKTYTQLGGDPAFHAAMADLLLGATVPPARLAAAAATGGTGAVRLGMELIRAANPGATVFITSPTWPSHMTLADKAGLAWKPYRYHNPETGGLDRNGLWADLDAAKPGDVVLLHGCCHNPTGAEMTLADWAQMSDFLTARGLTGFVDIAYQGFGGGLEQDAAGLRLLAARQGRMLVAASGAKNFGLYRERAGILLVPCEAGERDVVAATLATLNRASISFPPDHGARVITTILTDPALRADWEAELTEMRERMAHLRSALATALRDACGSDRFGYLADQRGMFSLLGGDETRVARLREEFGVYVVGGGRLNMAGLTRDAIPRVARAIAAVL